MNESIPPCPFCGNEHPEPSSGDLMICGECSAATEYNDWSRRTPPPATAKLIRCIKADLEPTDKMLDAFLAEWADPATSDERGA